MYMSVPSHLYHVNALFLIVFHILFFFRTNNLSNSPPYQGAETKLNCLLLFIYLATDKGLHNFVVCFSWSSLHAMNIFNDMSFDFEVPQNALLSLGKQYKVPFCVYSGKGTLVKIQYCQLQWVQTTLIWYFDSYVTVLDVKLLNVFTWNCLQWKQNFLTFWVNHHRRGTYYSFQTSVMVIFKRSYSQSTVLCNKYTLSFSIVKFL